ncbi:MAG: hypothetical protein K8M05_06870, partial [Deltaproteobacteria bacterium]|nr:hypothetical protein [Kofleriaceae bacterium]
TSGVGRRTGGDRHHSFRIASAEASEALTHTRIAVAWGFASESALAEVGDIEDRLQAVLYRLRHPRR